MGLRAFSKGIWSLCARQDWHHVRSAEIGLTPYSNTNQKAVSNYKSTTTKYSIASVLGVWCYDCLWNISRVLGFSAACFVNLSFHVISLKSGRPWPFPSQACGAFIGIPGSDRDGARQLLHSRQAFLVPFEVEKPTSACRYGALATDECLHLHTPMKGGGSRAIDHCTDTGVTVIFASHI